MTFQTAGAAGQTFTIRNVAVDESAGDAQEARRIAIRAAQRVAWQRLVERMVTGDPSLVAEPDTETLETLVQSLEFADEKITTGRYRAAITVRFRADGVLGWLEQSGVPHASAPSPVILVLPVLQTLDGNQLWEEGNPWLAAWQRRPGFGYTVELVSPVADFDDLVAIDTDAVLSGDWIAMQTLLARYQADGVLVALARVSGDQVTQTLTWYESARGENIPVDFQLAPVVDEPAAYPTQDVIIDTSILDEVGELTNDLGDVVEEVGDTVIIDSEILPAGQVDYAAAVDIARQRVNDYWTASNQAPEGPEAVMVAEVPIRNLSEWVDIRSRLARPAALNQALPLVVSVDHVRVLLRYVGTLEDLRSGLRRVGLNLTAQGNTWIILPL
ncbi:MAG: DUF2066 domain-containing protein [Alphaproteobacteria bacterium]|nr:DUF2066 domain-containing protein [Rhodospirillaceae bacterium]MBT6203439.1 DUF2066 domain-containing protein [Rhodospirillaceae bacterium]MBT6510020.1 DUF2066 domain-containing protein [Rhodospirillaceae bacterium]MBT7611648.1 DUF2066 domain-containing protein [Rhodospirillaceae bacterium]MDG2480661.1 DUF2066 domain-containing protein [Alphaproteobacteria bacterium]